MAADRPEDVLPHCEGLGKVLGGGGGPAGV